MTQIPVILCFKWGEGYPTLYTNTLARAVADHMDRPYRFICITDHDEGLIDGIETLPLPEIPLPAEQWTPGMWPKLSAFYPDIIAKGTPVLMLDVDVVLTGTLDPLFDRVAALGGLHIIADWPDTLERWFPKWWIVERLSNSSVVGFVAGEQDHIWAEFARDAQGYFERFGNDQNMIHHISKDRHYWPLDWRIS